jgi:histidyl-tRNA synthetase
LQVCLEALGIAYRIDPGIVRGLDYYTKTVFEVISNHIGSQGTVCGGGRYDGLVETCGGPDMPGVGFGMGMERILLVMEAQGVEIPEPDRCDVFVATFKNGGRALEICERLRRVNVRADYDPLMRSMKAQMRHAEKLGVSIVLIEGEDEQKSGTIQVKVMEDGQQQQVPFEDAMRHLTEIFGMVMG